MSTLSRYFMERQVIHASTKFFCQKSKWQVIQTTKVYNLVPSNENDRFQIKSSKIASTKNSSTPDISRYVYKSTPKYGSSSIKYLD